MNYNEQMRAGWSYRASCPRPYSQGETIAISDDTTANIVRNFTEEFDSLLLNLSCPAGSASYGVGVEAYTEDGLVSYMWLPGMVDTTAKVGKCKIYRDRGEWIFEVHTPIANTNNVSNLQRNVNFVSAEKPITKLVVYVLNSGKFPNGTTIDIRKA